MRKRTIKLAGMIALFFMALSMIGNWIISWSLSNLTEENTTLFTATVEEVQVTGAADDVRVTILVKEYPTGLLLFDSRAAAVPPDRFRALQPGQQIWFRVENNKAMYLEPERGENVPFVPICTLKTETDDIFTLEAADHIRGEFMKEARMVCGTAAVVSLGGGVALLMSLRREKKRRLSENG